MHITLALAVIAVAATSALADPVRGVLYVHGTAPPALESETLRLGDTGRLGYSGFRDALVADGFVLTEFEAGPGSVGRLTPELLALNKVVFLSSNNRRFEPEEAAAVAEFVHAGGGLVAFSDAAFGRQSDPAIGNTVGLDSNNALTAQFGLTFLRDNGRVHTFGGQGQAGDYRFDSPIATRPSPDGDTMKVEGEGVSPIQVDTDVARVLVRLSDVDGSQPVLAAEDVADGVTLDDTIAAVAVAEVGDGRVVGTFDRNTFWNAGPGSDITRFDNRQFGVNLVRYAAGEP